MDIKCPYSDCNKTFVWEPPKEKPMMRMIIASASEEPRKKRYVFDCPYCKKPIELLL
jgi:hypothetical protein